jgi:hypothetical protein
MFVSPGGDTMMFFYCFVLHDETSPYFFPITKLPFQPDWPVIVLMPKRKSARAYHQQGRMIYPALLMIYGTLFTILRSSPWLYLWPVHRPAYPGIGLDG